MSATTDSQVVVVGAGPVGSMAAYLLAIAGVEVSLIDPNETPVLDYRASTFHPPTLDLLEASGVSAALTDMGLACPVIQYRDRRSGPIGELDLSVLADDTNYPYRLQCEQFKLTGWLLAQLAELPNAHLALGRSVTGVTQDGSATVHSTGPNGDEAYRGRYVIAGDGARSTMRRELGIAFEGYTHPEQFLVAGAQYDFKSAMRDIQSVNYTSDPDEWFLLLQIPDMWRIVVPVPVSLGASDDARSDDYIQRCLQNICPAPEPYEILVRSVYRVHQRVASTYRNGVAFLAGDAAHVNNPLGGMGLNGGIHDVLLLTELLTRVLGGADDAILDGYEARRRPVAINDINRMTERNKKILQERDPHVRAANNEHLRAVCSDPALAYDYALEVSMIRSLRAAGTLPPRLGDVARAPLSAAGA